MACIASTEVVYKEISTTLCSAYMSKLNCQSIQNVESILYDIQYLQAPVDLTAIEVAAAADNPGEHLVTMPSTHAICSAKFQN